MIKIKNFIKKIKLKSVSAATIVRLVMMVLAIVAWILKMFGVMPPAVDESTIADVVLVVFGIVAFLQAYWKNNSWTEAAQIADGVMKYKKEELEGADWHERN